MLGDRSRKNYMWESTKGDDMKRIKGYILSIVSGPTIALTSNWILLYLPVITLGGIS